MMSDAYGDDQNTKKDKVEKGTSTLTEASRPNISKKASDNSGATVSSAVENQHGQDSPTNVKEISENLVPRKNYKVEEKVVQEKTGKSTRKRATLLHFVPTRGLPDVARVQLLLSNISERPLQFKLKSEPGPNISALPSSKGYIDAHGSAKCVLTWRRERNVNKWSDAQQPKLLLVLDFFRDKMENEKRTLTKLVGKVLSGQTCDPHNPPIEQLMLDAVATEYSRLISREAVRTIENMSKETEVAKPESLVSSIANWLSHQSKDTLLGLLFLITFFYFLGTLNSSKQKQHDE